MKTYTKRRNVNKYSINCVSPFYTFHYGSVFTSKLLQLIKSQVMCLGYQVGEAVTETDDKPKQQTGQLALM